MSRPLIFIGPSGVGKGTIEKKLQERHPNLFAFSVSHTTRKIRPNEVDGREYHFVSIEIMEKMIQEGKFLETCKIHGNLYGTSFAAIEEVISTKKICMLDVNIDGALAIYSSHMNPYIILLKPVSMQALEERLRGRNTDNEESINIRMQTAREEMLRFIEHADKWNSEIINDTIEETLKLIDEKLNEIYGI